LRSDLEGVGGKLKLVVELRDRPPVVLSGLGEDQGGNRRKRRAAKPPNRSPKPAAKPEPLGPSQARSYIYFKINQNKDLFIAVHLAETFSGKLK
jgi:hypothetical protein